MKQRLLLKAKKFELLLSRMYLWRDKEKGM